MRKLNIITQKVIKNETIREMSGFRYQLCSICDIWKKNEEFPFVPKNVSSWLKADRICWDCQEKRDAKITKSLIEEKKKLKETKPDPISSTKEDKIDLLLFESDTLTPPKKQEIYSKKSMDPIHHPSAISVFKEKIPKTTEEITHHLKQTNTQKKEQRVKTKQLKKLKYISKNISKVCTQCGKILPLDCFHKRSSRKSGYSSKCKDCVNAYLRAWNKKNKLSKKSIEKQILEPTVKTASASSTKMCNGCKKELPISSFRKTGRGRYRGQCKECQSQQDRAKYAKKKELQSKEVKNNMPSSSPSTYVHLSNVEENPINIPTKEPLFSENSGNYQQYSEAKTIVFLLEFMISQIKITPEVLQTVSFILQDLNTSSNPYLKTYLTETISKVKQFQEITK